MNLLTDCSTFILPINQLHPILTLQTAQTTNKVLVATNKNQITASPHLQSRLNDMPKLFSLMTRETKREKILSHDIHTPEKKNSCSIFFSCNIPSSTLSRTRNTKVWFLISDWCGLPAVSTRKKFAVNQRCGMSNTLVDKEAKPSLHIAIYWFRNHY